MGNEVYKKGRKNTTYVRKSSVVTSITLRIDQVAFLKEQNINISAISRALLDAYFNEVLASEWKKFNKPNKLKQLNKL